MFTLPLVSLNGKQRFQAGLSIVVACVQAAAFLPITFCIREIFDSALVHKDSAALLCYASLILVMYLTAHALDLWNRKQVLKLTKDLIALMRSRLMHRTLDLPREKFMRLPLGTTHSMIVNDTERIDMFLNAAISLVLPATIVSLVMLGSCLIFSAPLTVIVIGACLLNLLFSQTLRQRIRSNVSEFHSAFGRFNESSMVLLRAYDLLNAHRGTEPEMTAYDSKLHALRDKSRNMALLQSFYILGQHSLSALTVTFVLIVGGLGVINGSLHMGELAGFFAALVMLRSSFGTIIDQSPVMSLGIRAMNELRSITAMSEIAPSQSSADLPLHNIKDSFAVKDLTFSYGHTPVLDNISFSLQPGEVVALTGPNGAGKTTLLHLILGFYKPESGQLLVDGNSYSKIDLETFKDNIGYVPQHPLLVPGTVRDNITFGNAAVAESALSEICDLIGLTSVIDLLPNGLDTPLGDDGHLLSGGQRQLIAITRACVRCPSLLLLDEPTSHLDSAAVQRLLGALAGRFKDAIIIVATHDESVVQAATRTIDLNKHESPALRLAV